MLMTREQRSGGIAHGTTHICHRSTSRGRHIQNRPYRSVVPCLHSRCSAICPSEVISVEVVLLALGFVASLLFLLLNNTRLWTHLCVSLLAR